MIIYGIIFVVPDFQILEYQLVIRETKAYKISFVLALKGSLYSQEFTHYEAMNYTNSLPPENTITIITTEYWCMQLK